MKYKEIIAYVLLVITGYILVVLLNQIDYSSSKTVAYKGALTNVTKELYMERYSLEMELEVLKEEYQEVINGQGSGSFLFTELDERLYSLITPILEKYQYTAMMGISKEEWINKEHKLTRKQLEEMLEKGWLLFLYYDGLEPIEDYLKDMKELLTSSNIPFPQTIYFCKSYYHREVDELLLQYGLSIVIQHGEEGDPILTRDDHSELWYIQSFSYNKAGIKSMIDNCAKYGGVFVMNIDFGETRSGYQEGIFTSMLQYIAKLDHYFISDPYTIRSYRNQVKASEEMEEKIIWYQNEIDRIDYEINEIYKNNSMDEEE